MSENYFESYSLNLEDCIIVILLSLSITYLVFTIIDYYKPKLLIDLGYTLMLQ